MNSRPDLPRGLVFFPAGAPPGRRRVRMLFVATFLAGSLALIWPIYPFFARPTPLILGLPLSLVWPVALMLVQFLALWLLYRSDHP